MTYRDLLTWEHPEELNEKSLGGCNRCPKDYGYENSMCCVDVNVDPGRKICTECWDREITDTKLLEEKGLVVEEKAKIPYIELLKLEHPDEVRESTTAGRLRGLVCPHGYGYEDHRGVCPEGMSCVTCWERDIEDPKLRERYYDLASRKANENTITAEAVEDTVAMMKDDIKVVGEEAKKAGISIQEAVYRVSGIKDSGDRTEFETGAVRDMHEGKGRCDLMPLDVIGDWKGDEVLDAISCFVDENERGCLVIALEKFCDDVRQWDFPTMLLEVAVHFEEGAKKYGDNNWRKGIPVRCYIDSAVRHYLKYLRGDKDERHDRAFCWNILCCIWTCKHHPELNDYSKKEPSADA